MSPMYSRGRALAAAVDDDDDADGLATSSSWYVITISSHVSADPGVLAPLVDLGDCCRLVTLRILRAI